MTYKRAKIESSRTKTNYESVFVGRAIQLCIPFSTTLTFLLLILRIIENLPYKWYLLC